LTGLANVTLKHIKKIGSDWSIGIFSGNHPQKLKPYEGNPVLTAGDVTDIESLFVADPFLFYKDRTYYMFFEVMGRDGKGRIGYAKSKDGFDWKYKKIIIDEPWHISYPYVFEHNGKIYMLPETYHAGRIFLYRAVKFPEKFKIEHVVARGRFVDPDFLEKDGICYIICNNASPTFSKEIHIFYSNKIDGDWRPHPKNPIKKVDRNSGNIIILDGQLIRPFQGVKLKGDTIPAYGRFVGGVKFELSKDDYKEKETTFLIKPGHSSWATKRTHHISFLANKGIAAIDGSNS
jgi:hypothetical protein